MRKLRLVSKFMTSRRSDVTIHRLSNISRSKYNQTMKLASKNSITWEIFILKNRAENEVEKKKSKFSIFPDQESEML